MNMASLQHVSTLHSVIGKFMYVTTVCAHIPNMMDCRFEYELRSVERPISPMISSASRCPFSSDVVCRYQGDACC